MVLHSPDASEEFERLLRENLDLLYRMALSLTRDREKAEELVQEASVRAFRNFAKFVPGTNARAWLLTVLRNVFINEYRRKAREREVLESLKEDLEREKEVPDLPEWVRTAIRRLPEEQRLAVDLFYSERLSYQEIAQVMECPMGTVMSRLHAARKKLMESLPGRPRAKEPRKDELPGA